MIWRAPRYSGPERRRQQRWRPRPLRVMLTLLVLAAMGYGAAVLYLVSQETRLVFQAGRTLSVWRPEFPFEQIDVPRADGARQFAWIMEEPGGTDAPWVLFLHGNAATIAAKVNIAHYTQLRRLGLNVMAPEYRGFGGLDGIPTEAGLAADARAAYDYLRTSRKVPPSRLVIYGWSLGSAVAVTLASEVDAAGLILEGAPASLVNIREQQYPFFPVRLLMRNPFESISRIDRVRAPKLFLHSPEDAVIPISEGRRLFAAARGDKTFVEVHGGHVNATTVDTEHFYGAIRSFLATHHLAASEVRTVRR
jgi:dipeptidyl aminopeptidase/acylaminoacyl peptidase